MRNHGVRILGYLAGGMFGAGAFGAIFFVWSASTLEAFDFILWTPLGAIIGLTVAVILLILWQARKREELATWEWILLYLSGAVLGASVLFSPAMLVTTRSSWWVDLTNLSYGDWVIVVPGAALTGTVLGVVAANLVRKRFTRRQTSPSQTRIR